MTKFLAAAAVFTALTGALSLSTATQANAAPPTATVSPGYDAALAASRSNEVRSTDVSSRRYRRYRYYGPRYYRPYGYGYAPYGYYGGYRPYGYYGGPGYYGRPGIGFSFGF